MLTQFLSTRCCDNLPTYVEGVAGKPLSLVRRSAYLESPNSLFIPVNYITYYFVSWPTNCFDYIPQLNSFPINHFFLWSTELPSGHVLSCEVILSLRPENPGLGSSRGVGAGALWPLWACWLSEDAEPFLVGCPCSGSELLRTWFCHHGICGRRRRKEQHWDKRPVEEEMLTSRKVNKQKVQAKPCLRTQSRNHRKPQASITRTQLES